ncbi:[Pyruvate dehydrogenase (acetyl-transferring)] kinase isozyme 2, mitochondrial [Elysia marginata]|uniref:Protein-serine/threonine kinase n=1 Tax=Elysia marginata TaxID=1093978 RepID=A0AAV4ISG0_9GAST|nr:[Pyruvate dehydrogenase (acetyl-transferring)] kinase isozyme 2, mitochondrial [Elysia marginata]
MPIVMMMLLMAMIDIMMVFFRGVVLVRGWYEQSFRELIEFETKNSIDSKTLEKFTSTLVHIRNRHSNVVETMAQGVIELKETHGIDINTENRIQYFLDRFYMSRISIRMLINQHSLLFGKKEKNNDPRHIGCIDPNCNVSHVVQGLWHAILGGEGYSLVFRPANRY